MKRLWTLRILGIFFIVSASWITYYNFTNSGRAPFWRDTLATLKNVHEVKGQWVDEKGKDFSLIDIDGGMSMMTFVYLDCDMTCPRIMVDLKRLDDALKDRPSNFAFHVFLFQPESKSSITIKEFRKKYSIIARKHWHILSPKNNKSLHTLADVFSLNYSQVPDGNRKYKHTNFYALVSTKGKVIFQQRGFLNDLEPLLNTIKKATDGN